MWFNLGFQNFVGKKNISTESCDIFISDFKHIWHKTLSNNELLLISKALNPLLEASVQKLKDVTLKLLQDEEIQKEIKQDNNNNKILKLQSHILGVKFRFEILLEQGDGDMFYKELTIPLLLLLMNIKNKEEKLIKIIEDKDAEIDDLKKEYGTKSNYLTTKPFNNKEFECIESDKSDYLSNSSSFFNCITSTLSSFKALAEVKQEKQLLEEESDMKCSVEKCNKNKLLFKDKSFNVNKGSTCVVFDNQTIKKRRKHNGEFKIKF